MIDEETRAKWEAWRKRARTHLDLAERAAQIGYWRYDLRSGAYYWSPGMYRLLEESPETQKPDMEFLFARMLPQDRETIDQAIKTAIKTGSPFTYRTRARDSWSKTRIIDTQGEVEVDENGRTVVLLGVCHDVTDRVRAEEAREEAQAMYRLMTEECGDIIILYSTDRKMLFVSNALERITGRTADDIRDGGYKRFIHPDDLAEAARMIERPVQSDVTTVNWRFLHRDGHYIWLETTLRTVYDETGAPKNVISVSRDVSARRQAELERRDAHDMYRVMTTEASDIILLFGADSTILFASEALGRVLGRTTAEIEHGRWRELLHPDDWSRFKAPYIAPKQGVTETYVYRLKHGEGHYIWLEVLTRSRFAADGTHEGYISVARDITARREKELEAKVARERAEAANKAKSQFLANMSHELRTPLNAIIGFADLMRAEAFGPVGNPRYRDYVTLVYDSGQLLLDLITDMLDMAKIEAGKLELNMERVDLGETVADVVRLLDGRAQAAGIALETGIEAKLSLVADRRAVKQVVINLLSNAIKFTPRGGRVRVQGASDGGFMRITVSDDGIGIPQSEIARLGQPFEQVCDDPMLAKAGTGLGLALVRALAEKHGGALTIKSAEGVGTEVSVTFALAPARQVAA